MVNDDPIIRVENLEKYFKDSSGILDLIRGRTSAVQAVDDVSFSVYENESIGIIGESGCGKSTLLKTLMGLHMPTGGEIYYRGSPVSGFDKADWKEYRRNIQIIFQDPFNSHDPKFTVRESLHEPLKIHDIGDRTRRVEEVLEKVELSPVEHYIDKRPQHLSGGEKQRLSIARALILEPDVVLADEPVSMLDVSTQVAILNLLNDLAVDEGVAIVYISHDLSTLSYICETINVMYIGRLIERGTVAAVTKNPKHPYTQALINAVPLPDPHSHRERTTLEGSAVEPRDLGEGCRFRDRCPERMEICEKTPEFIEIEDDHYGACHLYYDHDETRDQGADQTEVVSRVDD